MSGGWSCASRTHYQMGRSGANPFVLRLASNYTGAQGGSRRAFSLDTSVQRAQPAKWTYLSALAKSFTRFDSGVRNSNRVTIVRDLRYEKSLRKCRDNAITQSAGLREALIKLRGSQRTGRLNDLLPIYAMR